jgi:hypothetical protein
MYIYICDIYDMFAVLGLFEGARGRRERERE